MGPREDRRPRRQVWPRRCPRRRGSPAPSGQARERPEEALQPPARASVRSPRRPGARTASCTASSASPASTLRGRGGATRGAARPEPCASSPACPIPRRRTTACRTEAELAAAGLRVRTRRPRRLGDAGPAGAPQRPDPGDVAGAGRRRACAAGPTRVRAPARRGRVVLGGPRPAHVHRRTGCPASPACAELAALPESALDAVIDGLPAGVHLVATTRRRQRRRRARAMRSAPGSSWPWPATCAWSPTTRGSPCARPASGSCPTSAAPSRWSRPSATPRALEMCVTGRWVGAEEAVRLGLAQLAVPRAELDAATDDLVAALLGAPAGAVRRPRRCCGRPATPPPTPSWLPSAPLRSSRLRALAGRAEARRTGPLSRPRGKG